MKQLNPVLARSPITVSIACPKAPMGNCMLPVFSDWIDGLGKWACKSRASNDPACPAPQDRFTQAPALDASPAATTGQIIGFPHFAF
jgi:hypothetical protein